MSAWTLPTPAASSGCAYSDEYVSLENSFSACWDFALLLVIKKALDGGRYQRYGERFLRRVYHDSERAEFERRRSRCEARGADFLASRWSAKEAAYKALGGGAAVVALCRGSRLQFPELVVQRDVRGGVSMHLLGAAATMADAAGVGDTHLSLSHEEEYAVAVVVALASDASTCRPDSTLR